MSRIRDYHNQQIIAKKDRIRISALEFELDGSERRNLHLNKELLNEATLRARSERARDEMSDEVEGLRDRLEREIQLDENVKSPQRIEKSRGRVTESGTVSEGGGVPGATRETQAPVPLDLGGNPNPTRPAGDHRSSRKRGGVK